MPLAAQLCTLLHGTLAQRRAGCCGGSASSPLIEPCERAVSAALVAGSVSLDRPAMDRCQAAIDARFAGCDWVAPGLAPLPDECQGLIQGQLATGSVCRSSLECSAPSYCAGLTSTKTGICTAPRAVGAACGAHVDPMAAYLLERALEKSHPFCEDFCSLVTHRCEPIPDAGSACFSSVNCAPGQRCTSGRCSAEPLAEPGEDCSSRPCSTGLRCNAGQCVPNAKPGEACATDFDCETGGCVPRDDGTKACGMKCIASLDALSATSGARALKLPVKTRH